MRRAVIAVVCCALVVVGVAPAASAGSPTPANDRVSGATAIDALPFSDTVDTTNATLDQDDEGANCFSDVGGSVWYRVIPAEDMRIDFTTAGSNFAATLEAYDEATREVLACSDDSAWDGTSSIRLQVTAGQTYLIRAAGAWGETGTLVFGASRFIPAPPAPNDTVSGATSIASLPFSERLDVSSATTDGDDAIEACFYSVVGSVWYRLSSADDKLVELTTAGSDYHATIEVVEEDTRSVVACAEDLGYGDGANLRFSATAGTTYLIRVASAWTQPQTLEFAAGQYVPPPQPPNDTVAGATVIETLPFSDSVNTAGAVDNTDDDTGCFGSHGASVWYRYEPAETTRLDLRTTGSDFDTLLEVFDARTGEVVGCDDDGGYSTDSRLRLELDGGTEYLIRAAGFAGSSGDLVLKAKQIIPLAATLQPAEIGTVTPGGRAIVSFTMTCNQPADGATSLQARQAVGPLLAAGESEQTLACNDTVSLPVRFTPHAGTYTVGVVEVDWAGYACSRDDEDYYEGYDAIATEAETDAEVGDAPRALKLPDAARNPLPDHDRYDGTNCVELTGSRNVVLLPGT